MFLTKKLTRQKVSDSGKEKKDGGEFDGSKEKGSEEKGREEKEEVRPLTKHKSPATGGAFLLLFELQRQTRIVLRQRYHRGL